MLSRKEQSSMGENNRGRGSLNTRRIGECIHKPQARKELKMLEKVEDKRREWEVTGLRKEWKRGRKS